MGIYRNLVGWPVIGAAAAVLLVSGALTAAPAQAADEGTLARGGKLYDKWFKVAMAPTPKKTHKSWPASNTKKKGNATHRCKSCHGWDYMGKDGAYASGSYLTGIPGVRKYAGGDPAKVIAIMKDDAHGYEGKMDAGDFAALAAFVTEGQLDMDKIIDRKTKLVSGDTAKGKAYYDTVCLNCHGADGKLPKDMPALGGLSHKNPWETLHKVLNGQPGEGMPGLRSFPMSFTTDIVAYLQTLPK